MVAPAGRRHYLAPRKKCGGLERRLQQGLRPHCASPAHDQVLIAALQFPASVRVTAWGRLPPQELIICQFVVARAGRHGMVGRCSEILERLAVEPKMIPPGLKIRSLGQTSVPGQSRHFDRAPLTSGLPRLADILRVSRYVSQVPKADIASPW